MSLMERSNKKDTNQSHLSPTHHHRTSPPIDHDDSLLDDDDTNFDLQNQIYRLRSQYHDLELDKTKMEMAYETTIRELKKKHQILERYLAERNQQDQREKGKQGQVEQLRQKCAYLADENEDLKQRVKEANRLTPQFPQAGFNKHDDQDMLQELIKSEDKVQALERQLVELKLQKEDLVGQNCRLQQESSKMKKERKAFQRQKQEYARAMTRQTEQHHNVLIRHKDKIIEQLKKQKINLNIQVEELRQLAYETQQAQQRENRAQFSAQLKGLNSRLQEKEVRIVDLEQEKEMWGMERERMREEKGRWDQKWQAIEKERRELQQKKKALEDELYRKECEVQEARTSTFSDKIEAKKQLGIIRMQLQEQKNQALSLQEQKTQQNNSLKATIIALNQQNDQFKQHLSNLQKQLQEAHTEARSSQAEKEELEGEVELLRSSQQRMKAAVTRDSNNRVHEEEIAALKASLSRLVSQQQQTNRRLSSLTTSKDQLQQQVQIKADLVQLMTIEKEEAKGQLRKTEQELKRVNAQQISKQKVIQSLEEEIKASKDDVKQLQEANHELIQQIETMKAVQNDIMAMRNELERERVALEQKKKQQQQFLKFQQERSLTPRKVPSQASVGSGQSLDHFRQTHTNGFSRINSSKEEQQHYKEQLQKIRWQVAQTVERNKTLQARLVQAEAELDRRGVDLKIKQEELQRLRRPQGLNLEVVAQANKKSQFNAVVLQNKILQLQKEISGIKGVKQKEFEEYKKSYRKKFEQKYGQQLRKANSYIHELKKKQTLLNDKLESEMMKNTQIALRIDELEKQNYETKYEYSESLAENNKLLQRIQKLEQSLIEAEKNSKTLSSQCRSMMQEYEKLSRVHGDNVSILSNTNEQVKRLSGLLVERQNEIKCLQGQRSSNGSFASHPYAHSRVIDKISSLTFRDQVKEEIQQARTIRAKQVIRTKI